MTLFIWFLLTEEFPCMKTLHIFLVMYWNVHFLGLVEDSVCRMCNVFLFFLSRQSTCAQYTADKREEERMCDHLIRAAKYRDHVTAMQLIQKIVNILTDKHGAWGSDPTR